MQLLHIKLGRLSHTGPQDGTSLLMHFQHMSFRFLPRIAKNPLKNHGDVAHQIDGIIVDDYLPGKIDIFFRTRFLGGLRDRYRASIIQNVSRFSCFFALRPASDAPPSLPTHGGNANIRRSQFKQGSGGCRRHR